MLCPVCGFDNYVGEDLCGNCGADLTASDTPEAATSFTGRLLGTHLDDLGAPEPVTADAGDDVAETIVRMRRDGTDCLLVLEAGRLVGIFTDRDAILKVAGRAGLPPTLRDVMTTDPVVLRRDDPIAVAIHKMAVGGFRHVPVMDGDRAVAVVSARDVFRHIATRLG